MAQEAALNTRGGAPPRISAGLLLTVNDNAFGPFHFDKNDCKSFTISTSTTSFVL